MDNNLNESIIKIILDRKGLLTILFLSLFMFSCLYISKTKSYHRGELLLEVGYVVNGRGRDAFESTSSIKLKMESHFKSIKREKEGYLFDIELPKGAEGLVGVVGYGESFSATERLLNNVSSYFLELNKEARNKVLNEVMFQYEIFGRSVESVRKELAELERVESRLRTLSVKGGESPGVNSVYVSLGIVKSQISSLRVELEKIIEKIAKRKRDIDGDNIIQPRVVGQYVSDKALKPNKSLYFFLSALLSFLISVGGVLVCHFISSSLSLRREVEVQCP